MREYRGKNAETGEWVYGGAYLNHYIVTGGRNIRDKDGEMTTIVRVDEKTVGEATRKYDRNDVEIFEGDWLLHTTDAEISGVWFEEGSFMVEFEDGIQIALKDVPSEHLSIMGSDKPPYYMEDTEAPSKLRYSATCSPSYSGSESPSPSYSEEISGSVSPEPEDDIDDIDDTIDMRAKIDRRVASKCLYSESKCTLGYICEIRRGAFRICPTYLKDNNGD